MKTATSVVQNSAALLIVGLAALLVIMGMTLWLGNRAREYDVGTIKARNIWEAAAELRSALQTAESSQRGYLYTGNQIYLAPLSTAKSVADLRLKELQSDLAGDQAGQKARDRLSAVIAEKFDEIEKSIALKRDRQDLDALAIVRTNRGKALMDEANLFLSSIIRDADASVARLSREQTQNAVLLQSVAITAGILIAAVVALVLRMVLRYTRALAAARDQVASLNGDLERRVEERTAQLAKARDYAEALLAEVNHRVANSLALVASMVSLQARATEDHTARNVLEEAQARIYAVSLVHKRLYSSADVRVVDLDQYLSSLLEHLDSSMKPGRQGVHLNSDLKHLRLRTDASVNLGVIVAEWVTNAFKYAYPDSSGEVRIRLDRVSEGEGELVVEDDGVGLSAGRAPQGTGLGTRLVSAMAASMGGHVDYVDRPRGTHARLVFPLEEAA